MKDENYLTEQNRRRFLKTTGAAAAGLSLMSGTTSAKKGKNKKKQSMQEADVVEEYNTLLNEYKFDEARQLLTENSVQFTSHEYLHESDGVSTEDFYGKSASSATFDANYFGVIDGEETWALVLTWDLKDMQQDVDAPAPKDKAALAFDSDVWGYSDDSLKHSGRITYNNGADVINNVTSLESEPVSDLPNAGVVTFDDRFTYPDVHGEGFMQMEIRRTDENSQGIVAGSYAHTWAIAGATELSLNVSLGGLISWDDPIGTDRWVLPNNDDRDIEL